jgi:hypothetical protein
VAHRVRAVDEGEVESDGAVGEAAAESLSLFQIIYSVFILYK